MKFEASLEKDYAWMRIKRKVLTTVYLCLNLTAMTVAIYCILKYHLSIVKLHEQASALSDRCQIVPADPPRSKVAKDVKSFIRTFMKKFGGDRVVFFDTPRTLKYSRLLSSIECQRHALLANLLLY